MILTFDNKRNFNFLPPIKNLFFIFSGLRDFEVRNDKAADVDGLHPYSHYRITVKAITARHGKPEEISILAETKQSAPDVKPVSSTIKPTTRVNKVTNPTNNI